MEGINTSAAELLQSQKTVQSLRKPGRKKAVLSLLGGLGVLLIALMLLGWGLSAMQWTVSTTTDRDSASRTFSIPAGSQDYWGAQICFPSSCRIPDYATTGVDRHGLYWASLPEPYTVVTGTLKDFVDLQLSFNYSDGARVWASGPNGNLSVVSQAGKAEGFSFPVDIPGNYSVHIMATIALSNTTGLISVALRTIVGQRQYGTAGLESAIVASTAILVLGAVGAYLGFQFLKHRRKPHPPREETADQDNKEVDRYSQTEPIPWKKF